jgi:O-antigen/teichoic acid export membrane protein
VATIVSSLGRALAAVQLVRAEPGDSSTASGRSHERYRRIVLTTLVSGGARVVSVASTLVVVPVALHYLGKDSYGLWLTITSVTALMGIADLGVGNGLVNVVAEAWATGDLERLRRQVASGTAMLVLVAAGLGAIFAAVYPFVDWAAVFNVSTPTARAAAAPAVAAFVVCLLVNLPLSLVQRVQFGFQEGYVAGAWTAAGALLGLVGVLVGVAAGASLPWLVVAQSGAPPAAALVNGLVWFARTKRWLVPRLRDVTVRAAVTLARSGGLFFLIQIAIAVAYESDALVVSRILGADSVPQYSVPMRLFAFAPMALGLLLAPLWPAYRDAAVRGDAAWVRTTVRRSLIVAAAVNVPPTIVLLFAGRPIVHLWVGESITPSTLLLFALAAWAALNSVGAPLAMLLNGLGAIRFQAICAALMMVANLGVSIGLTYAVGVSGVVWGTVSTQLVLIIAPSVWLARRLLRDAR